MIHLIREADGDAAGTLVLLHGRGADEHDLLPLLGVLDPKKRLRGITVGAPLSLPPGGRHWYALNRVGYPDPPTFAATYEQLGRFLDSDLGLDWERTVVGGFSQGGVMSYALGLGPGRPRPAGILAMSCFVPTVPGWEPDLADRAGLPVIHVHGELDPVIPVDFGRAARDLLAPSVDLEYHEFPGGHHVDPRLLPELARWLAARLPRKF
jgi:phospholipase/carboxylesterase